MNTSAPWLSGAALCPCGEVSRTLLSQLGQADPSCLPASPGTDILFTATVGRVQAHTDAKGENLLWDCRGSLALWGSSFPRAGRGAVCAPGQPCPLPGWCHPQYRGPLSAATSPLGTPTLGTATGCQRSEVPGTGSRTQGLCSPPATWATGSPTPGPPQQGMELGTAEEEKPPSWGTACS